MSKRTIESYAEQSYKTYLKKISDYRFEGRALKEEYDELEYKEMYYERKAAGMETSRLSSLQALSTLVLSTTQARNLAKSIIISGEAQNLDLDFSMNKSGTINVNSLASSIMSLDNKAFGKLISQTIDAGVFADGDDFEGSIAY